MSFIYQIGIFLYGKALSFLAFIGHEKASLFIQGRRSQKPEIKKYFRDKSKQLYWFHCASLGEFEQGKPLIEALKKEGKQILLTFFSPSGFEIKKNESLADFIFYLPLDSKSNAINFIDTFSPDKAFFIKYEIWPNYFAQLDLKNIPIFMISSTFRESQIYFKPYGKWFFKSLKSVSHFFLQDEKSARVLEKNNLFNYSISGDTRFDNVLESSKRAASNSRLELFAKDKFTIIIGSSWKEEEELISKIFEQLSEEVKLIIVPHDVSINHVNQIEKTFSKYTPHFYSDESEIEYRVLIVDSIGVLRSAYQYADVAFVGGGFKNALHNILEPVVFGLPVLFGNNHSKYHEANLMIDSGCGFEVSNKESLLVLIEQFQNPIELKQVSEKTKLFVESNLGATNKILEKLKEIELDEKQS